MYLACKELHSYIKNHAKRQLPAYLSNSLNYFLKMEIRVFGCPYIKKSGPWKGPDFIANVIKNELVSSGTTMVAPAVTSSIPA